MSLKLFLNILGKQNLVYGDDKRLAPFLAEIGCSDFGSYGITSREGANRIKGPGLWDSGVPGNITVLSHSK